MIDLIYHDACQKDLKEAFPDAVIEDASDGTHENMISIEIPDKEEDAYLRWMIKNKFAGVSFKINLMLYEKESREKIKQILNEESDGNLPKL